jgi:hypothetical protein
VYAACRRGNAAGQIVLGPDPSEGYIISATATRRVPGNFMEAYGCCAAAFLLDVAGGKEAWAFGSGTLGRGNISFKVSLA